jgi:hypothetical protein
MNPTQSKKSKAWLILPVSLALFSLACNAPGFGLSQLASDVDPEEVQAALEDIPAEELLQQLEQDPQFQQLMEQGLSPEEIMEQLEQLEDLEGLGDLQGLQDLSGLEGVDELGEGLSGFLVPAGEEPPPEVLAAAAAGKLPMCSGEYECDSLGYVEYQEVPFESGDTALQKWCVHIQYQVRERDQSGDWSPMLYLGIATREAATGWEFSPDLYLSQDGPRNCQEVLENEG